ncbi:MAG: CDP-glycerol glycerophosphotransferase family protein [Bacteroidaceae bacterium]|nr:CDP-glycerol glycerophosphotransferase family protein [Bacteroidaceae bacterium]
MIRKILYSFFRLLPIKRNRVLFIGYYGAQYGCNPKYISQALIRKYGNYVEVVWAFNEPSTHLIKNVRCVKYNSIAYFLILATSRIICTNYRMTLDFKKRKGQRYIQTWHSSLRLKKIEGDSESTLPPHYVKMAKHDSAQIDYVLAGCRKSHDTFLNSFWYSGEILDFGTPRNDLLIENDQRLSVRIKQQLSLPYNRKFVLYAPTFRENKATDCYTINFKELCHVLKNKFGGEWIVLLRLHPHLLSCELFRNIDNVIDVTSYDDIQELLLISNVLISDYSSLMFDFAISGKPVFLFASDVKEYTKNERALYFDIAQLPFGLAENNEILFNLIEAFDPREYSEKVQRFNRLVGTFENGTASSKVSELIINLIEQ